VQTSVDESQSKSLSRSGSFNMSGSASPKVSGLLRGNSSSKKVANDATAASAAAAVAANAAQGVPPGSPQVARQLSSDDINKLTSEAKSISRWVNGRPLLVPIVGRSNLRSSSSDVTSTSSSTEEENGGADSDKASSHGSASAGGASVAGEQPSMEDQPAKRSSARLESAQKSGPYVHSGLVNLSPISPHAEMSSAPRRPSFISSLSNRSRGGWDGKERLCTKHYHMNEELVEQLLTGAVDGQCICCQLATTRSPHFHNVFADGTVELHDDDDEASDFNSESDDARGKPSSSSSSGRGASGVRVPVLLAMPRGDRLPPGARPQLCHVHYLRNKRVIDDTGACACARVALVIARKTDTGYLSKRPESCDLTLDAACWYVWLLLCAACVGLKCACGAACCRIRKRSSRRTRTSSRRRRARSASATALAVCRVRMCMCDHA
jgi:hypothetical protein